MPDQWFYVENGQTRGPIDVSSLSKMAREGALARESLVWKEGLSEWTAAGSVPGLFPPPAPGLPPAPPVPERARGRGVLGGIGAKISEMSDLPTVSNVPVREILVGGLRAQTKAEDIEEVFAAGTAQTTPTLSAIDTAWPVPRVFWRIMGGALGVYILLRLGITEFQNAKFFPGMVVIGSFVLPLAVVVLFLELNTPRNVSVYQVGKMILLGGALSLIATMLIGGFIPGSGTGALLPSLLTGVIEELGKALALLLIVGSPRYRWQMNGLVFGAAVGAGFAGFESAGYAFERTFQFGLDSALRTITMRGIFTPGGHVIWTAIVGSALWKVKGDKRFEPGMLFHPVVVRRFGIAVVLHGLWDSDLVIHPWLQYGILTVVGWYIVFAILKQALSEIQEVKTRASPQL